jgi:hypothetical protein
MLSVIMLSVIMLSVIMLSVIMLAVIMLTAEAPLTAFHTIFVVFLLLGLLLISKLLSET